MKVYVVKAPQGDYEDYQEPIVKVFLDKKKAKQYIKDENAKLPLKQAKMCSECEYKWETTFKPAQPMPKCLKRNKYNLGLCENYINYQDIYELIMEEHEVEE